MKARPNVSFALAVIAPFVLCSAATTAVMGSPPTIEKVDIRQAYRHAYAGNEVTVTLNATHPQGVQRLYLMAQWSTYERGHDEFMAGDIELTPTGEPDQFGGSFTVPARDAKRLRAEARWRTGGGDWRTALKYTDVDYVASGPRRLRRIEAGKWQMLVPETAPPTPPVYPPQGEWRDTTYRLRPEWTKTSNWTWFRQEVAPEGWLKGARVELCIAQADYTCHAYVNGAKVGDHFGSGTSFAFDVTQAWRFGESNVIELAIGGIRTTFRDFNTDEMYNCLTPAVSSTGAMAGVCEGVALIAHATMHIHDVFDQTRKLVYTGRGVDNPRDAARAMVNDLDRTLEELLAGQPISTPVTNPIGCNVKWEGQDAHWMPPEACDLV